LRYFLKTADFRLFDFNRGCLLAVASLLVSSNIIVNVFVVERFLSPDQHILSTTKSIIYAYNAVSIISAFALAGITTRLREFSYPVRLHHALIVFIFLEGLLRITIFTTWIDIPFLRQARLYASPFCGDEEYFILRHYQDGDIPPTREVEPVFGWTGGTGALRIITDKYLSIDGVKQRPILFFGDSFIQSGATLDEKIPQMLGALIPSMDVLNYGVGGYGTDQISLRFQREYGKFESRRPIVLIGIMLGDMDRALLRYRGGQKPYYEIDGDALKLNMPKYKTNEEFVREHTFYSKSFVLSLLGAPVRQILRSDQWCAQKRFELNLRIIENMLTFIRDHNVDAYVVLFYAQNDLPRVSAREEEMKRIFSDLAFRRIIDTKEILTSYLHKTGDESFESLYSEKLHWHHSVAANRIIAEGIAQFLRRERRDIK
jgi:hypothetical protein